MGAAELLPLFDDDPRDGNAPRDRGASSPERTAEDPPGDVLSALPDELARHVRPASDLPSASGRRTGSRVGRRFPTGVPVLDRLLDGGLVPGRLVEIRGRPSSGRFATVLSLLAATTAAGEVTALGDLGSALDPRAARAAGVVFERLLWVRPEDVRQALSVAEILLGSAFPLVVVDLGLPPVPGGRGREASWLRLARAARRHRAALFVSAPYRVSGSAADDVLAADPRGAVWCGRGREPRLLEGLRTTVRLDKRRGGLPSRPFRSSWDHPAASVGRC